MIVKLANIIVVQHDPKKTDVSGSSSLLGYYTHPAVLGGGIAGGFAANELMEKFLPDTRQVKINRVGGHSLFGIPYGGKLEAVTVGKSGPKRRLLWNVGRGVLAAVGSGIAATGVAAYRKRKERDENMLVKLSSRREKDHDAVGMGVMGGILGGGLGYAVGPGVVEGIGVEKTREAVGRVKNISSLVGETPHLLQDIGNVLDGTMLHRNFVGSDAAGLMADAKAVMSQVSGHRTARPNPAAITEASRAARETMRNSPTGQLGRRLRVTGKLSAPAGRLAERAGNLLADHVVAPIGNAATRGAVERARVWSPIIGGLLGMGVLGGGAALANLNNKE